MSIVKTNHSWHYQDMNDIFQLEQIGEHIAETAITRIAPTDRKIEFEWASTSAQEQSGTLIASCKLRGSSEEGWTKELEGYHGGKASFDGLENGIDYELQIWLQTADQVKPVSVSRLARPGIIPGTVVNYIHPEDYTYNFSGRSPASPSVVKLPSGKWLASHDVFWGKGGQNLSMIFSSEDEGKTWAFVNYIYPCFWGKLFLHQGSLYMIGTSTEYGALLIGRSDDEGKTWTPPTEIIKAGSREDGGPHKAPMPVVEHGGRIWTAVEFGSWGLGGHEAGVVSAPADSDLLDGDNWTVAPFLPYDASWPGAVEGGKPSLLEGNIVVTPEGGLINLLRYNTYQANPDYGRAVMLNVDMNNPEKGLSFRKVIDFHGNMSKFTVHYDAVSKKYWSLVNRVTIENVRQRNILTLVSSADLEHWDIVCDVLNYEHNDWPEDDTKVGFQYVDWTFDGNDIAYLSRTAINGAHNYHNANYITFHRIPNFRKL